MTSGRTNIVVSMPCSFFCSLVQDRSDHFDYGNVSYGTQQYHCVVTATLCCAQAIVREHKIIGIIICNSAVLVVAFSSPLRRHFSYFQCSIQCSRPSSDRDARSGAGSRGLYSLALYY